MHECIQHSFPLQQLPELLLVKGIWGRCIGYDILLDEALKPWLLEVNHSPSFTTSSPMDFAIKEELLADTLRLVSAVPPCTAPSSHGCWYSGSASGTPAPCTGAEGASSSYHP